MDRRFAILQSSRLRYNLMAASLISLLLLILWWGGIFMNIRLRLNDMYFAPAPTSDSIVIIALDQTSLDQYGSTPSKWSRSVYVDLLAQLEQTNARVLAFDLLFSEIHPEDDDFAEALVNLRQSDARTRIVLADAGINNITATANRNSDTTPPSLVFGDDLPLSPLIVGNADYRGYTNVLPDIDSTVRRQASILMVDGRIGYSLSLATFLAYRRIPLIVAEQSIIYTNNRMQLTPNTTIPVDEYGLWELHYFGQPFLENDMTFPVISLVDVIEGNFDPVFFDDKIVMVGLINNVGLLDQYQVPSASSGNLMAGVEIQANAIESLIQNQFPQYIPDSGLAILIAGLVFFAAVVFTFPIWQSKIVLLIVILLTWFIILSIIFSTTNITIPIWDSSLALALPFLTSLGIDINHEQRQRQRSELLLDSLQNITEQHLQLNQIAFYILSDASQIVPDTRISLYIRQHEKEYDFIGFSREENSSDIQINEINRLDIPSDENATTFPIIWQSQLHGFLIASTINNKKLKARPHSLLQEYVNKFTPTIDNLHLYEELERQKLLLEAVFAESPASIAILNAEGQIVDCNTGLGIFFASDKTTLQERSFTALLTDKADNEKINQQLEQGFASQQSFSIQELEVGENSVRIDIAPLTSYNLWIVLIGDVTALVELSQLKTQLLRIAAHDLKNPLARIMGFTELLEMQLTLEEKHAKYINYILDGSNQMLSIINDILNLERLKSAGLNIETINLIKIIQEVCASHQPDIIQNSQEFEIQMPAFPIHVKADVGQLSQAITNFVGNAIKYTPEKGTITVRLIEEEKILRFEVQDTGYGIPEDAQDGIFNEFFRAKSTATAHIAGTGLGLSLSKSVVEAHGGQVGFTSIQGTGSTFFFTLPALTAEADDA